MGAVGTQTSFAPSRIALLAASFAIAVVLISTGAESAKAVQVQTFGPAKSVLLNRSETYQLGNNANYAHTFVRTVPLPWFQAAANALAGMAVYSRSVYLARRCVRISAVQFPRLVVVPNWYTGGHCKMDDTPGMIRGSMWYLRNSRSGGSADIGFNYGRAGDIPVAGDWNGDGVDTVAMVRGSVWYVRNSNTPGSGEISFNYGRPGDIPVSGDWNGDGVDTPGMIRGSVWYLRNSSSGGSADAAFNYGRPGDLPVSGDWNGDGVDTPGMIRGSVWYLRNSNSGGSADASFNYGRAGDIPVAGDWNADGRDTPGMVRGSMWYLRDSNSGGSGEYVFNYGRTGDRPVAGAWVR